MKLTKVTEDIFKYDNFLTQEECEKTINLFKKYEEEDPEYWKAISFYESYSAMYPQDNDPILEKFGLPGNWFSDLERRFKECAADLAGEPIEKISKISFHMQRWLPGAFAPLHSDNTSNDGKYGAFTRSRYAGFLYLNEDFEGGLLNFEADHGNNKFSVQPTTGSFVIFHGGHKNMHEVTMVKKGNRYTIGSFWDDREESDYPQETRDAWALELAEVRALQKNEQKEWTEVKEKGLVMTREGKLIDKEEVM
ncbi:Oxoglutarate/iron-dependent dioxygenase [uncultured Caudovirales phage]|uniref:procollagen-proline 3-dioxygenase n=1 Tax=uncultured Caudovirales phage TaxID=2100421 RepID=A0A6J5QTJ5_9CAUD|nr:Oxoglutarate/iron-dependent dioxygenase [uncultured Caudovirales phage]CAB4151111.1 Oxoglutarate/iron-dependent dioxygenase [uncultured Caudovirales phage]CAB4173830.1 Oxoglutarate/iron-dependent dioxygenase [uncultured Caudovirales phage]CAB4179744.1 Oxoglutarate/iron-dependent dioxygenase [uncultured Caudovirales phage]CAB4185877.1 Oxoglutarate/iron-dependent dioxygenase [uncultured Caudovirales phage]